MVGRTRTGDKKNAKEYPFWEELIVLLKQIGYEVKELDREVPLKELDTLIKESFTVITIDSFLQHYCWYLGKQAIAIWGKSDPEIFGHPENINLIKDRNNLRKEQFGWWTDVVHSNDDFVSPETIINALKMVK